MKPLLPLVVAIFVLSRTVFALASGAASAGNDGLLRDDEPIVYWLTILGGFAVSVVCFVAAYNSWAGS